MDEETKRLVTTSFLLGLRISQSINNLPPPDRIRFAALVESLSEVASGQELTLDAAADLQRSRPELLDFTSIQQDYTNQQRLIAKTICDRLFSKEKTGKSAAKTTRINKAS
jgi:hypothetical protein